MIFLRAPFKHFPAATRVVFICFSVSLFLWAGLRFASESKKVDIVLLGDSGIGNYRLEPGHRLQDFMEANDPSVRVENWAESGASPLDFYLQFCRGRLVHNQPVLAIIGLSPDRFLGDCALHRFKADGVNLGWIPWNRDGCALFRSLSSHQKNVAIVRQAGVPLYALLDFGAYLWNEYVDGPWQRKSMRASPQERRKLAIANALIRASKEESLVLGDEKTFDQLPMATDTRFVLDALHHLGVETKVMLLPFGDPALIQRSCSKQVLAKHDSIVVEMRHWLESGKEQYVDFNTPEDLAHFPDSTWDDWNHLKSPSAMAYISEKVERAIPTLKLWAERHASNF